MNLNKGIKSDFIIEVGKMKNAIATMRTSISLLEYYGDEGTLTVTEIDLLYNVDDYLINAEYTLGELMELMEATR
jgi:hypothetical protein